MEKSPKLDWFEKSDPRIGPLPRKSVQQIALRVLPNQKKETDKQTDRQTDRQNDK